MPNNRRRWFQLLDEPFYSETVYDPQNLLFSVSFGLNRDVIHHNRSVYTSLDLLGDVGGLFDALKGILSVTITLYFYLFGNPLHSYLVEALFLKNPETNVGVKIKPSSSCDDKL